MAIVVVVVPAVTVTDELQVCGASVFGFTFMVSDPGRLPPAGLTVSHWSLAGVVAVKGTAPTAELRTDTVCAPGSVAPICHVNLSAPGVAVSVGALPAYRMPALSRAAIGSRNQIGFTTPLSAR